MSNPYKRKVSDLKTHVVKNEEKVIDHKDLETLIVNDIELRQPNHFVFKDQREHTVDWKPMIIVPKFFNNGSPDEADLSNQYASWEVNIEKIPERYIPYIDVFFLMRQVGNLPDDDNAGIEIFEQAVHFHVQDVENTIKTSTGISLPKFTLSNPFASKNVRQSPIRKLVIAASLWMAQDQFGSDPERYNIKPQEAKLMVRMNNPT